MELYLSSTPSSTFRDDFPFHPGTFLENSPPKPRGGFSLDLETPPSNENGFFYNLLHGRNTDIVDDDHGFSSEGSSSNPFSQVVSTPQLVSPFHHTSFNPHPTATFPKGFDLCAPPPPPPTPSPLLPPPPSLETSPESGERSYGVAAHGQVEFKSLIDYSLADHHRRHDPVTVDSLIMPLLDLNDPLDERFGEEFSSGGVSPDCQWGHERDGGGDDRSKREVVIGLPQQLQKQTTEKKKRRSEVDKEPLVVKGQWTLEEDRLLTRLVEMHGPKKWSQIARMLVGRVGKQCRERWQNHLRPDIKKDSWSIKEDEILIEAHKQIGNKWAVIAKILPGRTENTIKNHWNAIKRRQFSRRKLLPHNNSDLLQNYIRSVTTPSPPKRPAFACGRDHKTEKRSLSLLTAAISAANHPQQVPDRHHLQSPPVAQRPASSYFGFPMVDGNQDLGLCQVNDHHYHQVLSEGGGNGSRGRFDNESELDLDMSLEMDGDRRQHHLPYHHNDYRCREIKELDLLEIMARQSG